MLFGLVPGILRTYGEMGKIFISYRRLDSADFTVALYNRLSLLFGEEAIFKDINNIPPGRNFAAVLDDALEESTVVLAVIGPAYFSEYGERLFNENDWVRQEIVRSLERGLRVVPVLINGAPFPEKKQMPKDMWPLMSRQATTISNESFSEDVFRLAQGISDTLPMLDKQEQGKDPDKVLEIVFRGVLLLLMVASIGLAIFAWTISEAEFKEKVFMSLLSFTGFIGGGVSFSRQRWLELRAKTLTNG